MWNEKTRYGFHFLNQFSIKIMDFYGSNMEEDAQEIIEDVSRVFKFVGETSVEKAELVSYQWKWLRPIEAGSMEWERFDNEIMW